VLRRGLRSIDTSRREEEGFTVHGLVFLAITQTLVLGAGEPTYSEAEQQAKQTGKPMLVFVSAQWCGACTKMKQSVLPELRRDGLLDSFHFAYVDLDENEALCERLSDSKILPELIVIQQTAAGRRSWHLEGVKSADDVAQFLRRTNDRLAVKPEAKSPR
jgi:thioredoxin-like negative regulator of GroEL